MRGRLTRCALAAAVAAGVTSLALGAAEVRSPARTALALLFLFAAPTAAVAGLLPSLDRFARLIIAFATTIAIVALTAVLMLMAGVWSPVGGLLVVAGITAACVAAQLPSVRRRASAREPGEPSA
jgi:uncharacterized membrane protein